MRYFKLFLLLVIPFFKFFAQDRMVHENLKGKIVGSDAKLLANEMISLYRLSDSVLVKQEFTDTDGAFDFQNLVKDTYFIVVQIEGYEKVRQEINLNEKNELSIVLNSTSKSLEEVSVVKKKPYIIREPGKFTLDIEASIQSTGSSAFEIIEKAPGVVVGSNDDIRFKGRTGIIVQINGKTLPMSGQDLANYLRGIPSNSIEKIAFISNPSAKYDAAGSAIIDIKLKKDTRFGTNGTFTSSYGQGVYPKAAAGLSLNHRTKKWNFFGSYNYSYRKAFNHLVLKRKFYENDTLRGSYLQDNYLTFPFKNQIARVGFDYQVSPKTSIGLSLNGVNNSFNPTGKNVSDVTDGKEQIISSFETTNHSKDKWQNFSTNFNLKHQLDTLGSEISTDIDYAHYSNQSLQNFETNYYDLNKNLLQSPYLLHGDLQGSLAIYSFKSDYAKKFKNNASLDMGVKSSYVEADNNVQFFDRSSGVDMYDTTKSNHFIYQENINAAYINFNHQVKKWTMQLGLRLEQTNIIGTQKVYNVKNDTSYLQLFPSISLNYKVNDNHAFDLNINRRIDRPSYDQLNPFKFYLDPSTYKAGNPYLSPQNTYGIDVGYSLKGKYYFSLGYALTNNNIAEILLPQTQPSNVTVQTMVNFPFSNIYFLNMNLPFDVTKWWTLNVDVNSYLAQYNGTYANTTLNNRGTYNYNINAVNSITLGKTTSLEVSGHYRTREVYGFDSIRRIWFVGFGLQQKIFKNNGTLKLNVTDVCFSNKISADVRFRDYHEFFIVSRETRVVTFSFTYRFGNTKMQGARRRAGGADDLKQRVNNMGNGS